MALLKLHAELLSLLKKNREQQIYELLDLKPITRISSPFKNEQTYSDGSTGPDALFTSFSDYHSIYNDLKQRGISSLCDLGGGVGKGKILIDALENNNEVTEVSVTSIEIVEQRHLEGLRAHQKLSLRNDIGFINADLLEAEIPNTHAYFIYLPVGEVLDRVISHIESIAMDTSIIIYAIESHGDLISYLQTFLPLTLLKKVDLISQRHDQSLYIFELPPTSSYLDQKNKLLRKSNELLSKNRGFSTGELSTRELWEVLKHYQQTEAIQFVIKERDQELSWLGDVKQWSFGVSENTIELKKPYRIVQLNSLKALVKPGPKWEELIDKRNNALKGPLSTIRKIIIYPTPSIEYANGDIESVSAEWELEELVKLKS